MPMPTTTVFDSIPQEVLENIAFFAVASNPIGPPRELLAFLLVNRRFYSMLSSSSNPYFHSRIFATKFDTSALIRRLGPEAATPPKLAMELRRRWVQLGRLRARAGCTVGSLAAVAGGGNRSAGGGGGEGEGEEGESGGGGGGGGGRGGGGGLTEEAMRALHEMLWTAYLMMLENDGLNERQLREYAQLNGWLHTFWFAEDGASCAQLAIRDNAWPPNNDLSAVTMWLFWFLLRPEEFFALDDAEFRNAISILKLLALGAHQYPVCRPAWVDFVPNQTVGRNAAPPAYAEYPPLSPPPLAAPAVLSYLSLAPRSSTGIDALQPMSPLAPSSVSLQAFRMSFEWDCEWERCKRLAGSDTPTVESPTGTFKPGTMEGIWEGLFTYTEFTAYAALLSGAPPPTLNKSLVARHQQTWRLHEYHLLLPEDHDDGLYVPGSSTTATTTTTRIEEDPRYRPLSPGDPLRAYLPYGLSIEQERNGLSVHEPGRVMDTFYHRCPAPEQITREYNRRVREILIAGELDGDRGKWLYRGYFVGDAQGNYTGRWRDTLSPAEVLGYEGCFFMGRRR
ncbi:hypothetical protein B0F90DRAFT_1818953 [Multifurca ochricompacta]|uniref:F-box domain-containing protein n=1 Tax=Multifurca ochricompacta TaxID=376703 RepID=A0AAD4M2G1_9AGAM|nr:hypothetical protein B0F90DRAFT_1818953 [Multifurca ochricompacta]